MQIMLKLILREFKQWSSFFIIYSPESSCGRWLRKKYWGYVLRERLGSNPLIERGATIGAKEMVYIGDHFIIGDSAAIAAGDSHPIWIGNHVAIARHSWIRTANHKFDDLNHPIMHQGHNFKTINYNGKSYSIVIEDDVWIGANAVLVSGAHVGRGSVIGAGALISGFIPPYSVVIGNPGRVVKSRKINIIKKETENEICRN